MKYKVNFKIIKLPGGKYSAQVLRKAPNKLLKPKDWAFLEQKMIKSGSSGYFKKQADGAGFIFDFDPAEKLTNIVIELQEIYRKPGRPPKKQKMEKGGIIETNDGTKGGIIEGKTHKDGGVDAIVITDNDRPVELQDKEGVLSADTMESDKLYDFEGRKMTAKEIASRLNVDHGGVALMEKGGTINRNTELHIRMVFSGTDSDYLIEQIKPEDLLLDTITFNKDGIYDATLSYPYAQYIEFDKDYFEKGLQQDIENLLKDEGIDAKIESVQITNYDEFIEELAKGGIIRSRFMNINIDKLPEDIASDVEYFRSITPNDEKKLSTQALKVLNKSKDILFEKIEKDYPCAILIYSSGDNYEIKKAKYAKGKLAIHIKGDKSGFKNREQRLAEAKGVRGKYSHRENAYIVSLGQAKTFEKYVKEGYDYSPISDELEYPKGKKKLIKKQPDQPSVETGKKPLRKKAASAKKKLITKDQIKGGAGDNKTPEDIAKKYNVSLDIVEKQLKIGIDQELEEHTDNKEKAREIATDHIWKYGIDYYPRLDKMEKKLKKTLKNKK